MSLPFFTEDGVLPVGDYLVDFVALRASHLVTGERSGSSQWDATWRFELTVNLETLVKQLWTVGIDRIFVDGSFVENKDHPNDIDGYFECDLVYLASGQLQRELNALDPSRVWTWDHRLRRPDRNSAKMQLPMWHRYRIELYPHIPGLVSGIRDKFGNELEFPAAFRRSRMDDRPKGIIQMLR